MGGGATPLYIPKVKSIEETLNDIIENKKSVCRFGDGEFLFLLNQFNKKLYFNTAPNSYISERLKEILLSKDDKIEVCIWDLFGAMQGYTESIKKVGRYHMSTLRDKIMPYIDPNKIYGNSFISRFYLGLEDKKRTVNILLLLKNIWNDMNILLIEGEGTYCGVNNDLFDNAKSVSRIICPAENAASKYEEILSNTLDFLNKNKDKNYLTLIALGMSATVLAYDLAQKGFWAIDIGHLDIEYEWYKINATEVCEVDYKYVNDAGKQYYDQIHNEKYINQIVKKIVR